MQAEGEYLDRHAQLRSLERRPASAAEGVVRFTAGEAAAAPRTIPRGTVYGRKRKNNYSEHLCEAPAAFLTVL